VEYPDAHGSEATIYIYNLTGQLIMQQYLSGNSSKIDISSLSSGIYIILLQNESGRGEVKRFAKQ